MSNGGSPLQTLRQRKDSALRRITGEVAQLKQDLAPQALKQRALTEAEARARQIGNEALDIARDSKLVIAGTVAALGLWLFRKPVIRAARQALPLITDLAASAEAMWRSAMKDKQPPVD